MDYKEAIKYINDLCKFGINLGLGRTKTLLKLMGSPDEDLYIIHVAGTNGKGSTSAMLAAALENTGFRVGFYSSPHLHTYRERIKINGQDIDPDDFALGTSQLKEVIEASAHLFEESPTEFEFLTILAASYFKEKEVEIAIFETGLGGRLDSTNALDSDISIITNIGYDHCQILGNTIEEIAGEKAGIIRRNGRLVLALQEFEEAAQEIKERALFLGASLKDAREKTECMNQLSLSLKGQHQKENMLNVLLSFEYLQEDFQIDQEKFLQGLSRAKWPGRLETLSFKGREILLDGAHNPQGAKALRAYLDQEYKERKIYYLLAILDDKDKAGILAEVWERAEEVCLSRAGGGRSEDWQFLPQNYKEDPKLFFQEDPRQALRQIMERSKEEDLIVTFGSFYFINIIREIILGGE